MDKSEIKSRLNDVKNEIEAQKRCLHNYIENGTLIPEELQKCFDDKSNEVPFHLFAGCSFEETQVRFNDLRVKYEKIKKDSEIIRYDSFDDMADELSSIKENVEIADVPENMRDSRHDEVLECFDDITEKYQELIDSGFAGINDIIDFMDDIINNISEIV